MSSTRQTRSTGRAVALTPAQLSSSVDLPLAIRLRNGNTKPLLRKWEWLRGNTVPPPRHTARNPVPGTLVFGHDEAGTAVCISPDGVLLTCARCVAKTARELDLAKVYLLLFADGTPVHATVLAWDLKRDLTLLVIAGPPATYPYIPLSRAAPTPKTPLLCIGHPGSGDLKAPDDLEPPGGPANYDALMLSEGTFHGLSPNQDPEDNADIGALMHSCWTYRGHSGAPLVEKRSGALTGLHSGWDSATGMRRGVAWEAVESFVGELGAQAGRAAGPKGWRWCVRDGDDLAEV